MCIFTSPLNWEENKLFPGEELEKELTRIQKLLAMHRDGDSKILLMASLNADEYSFNALWEKERRLIEVKKCREQYGE